MFKSVKVMGLFITFVIGGESNAAFFDEAKAQCQGTLKQIKEHPFIVQLANGTLRAERFCYYLKQDDEYLDAYGKTLGFASIIPCDWIYREVGKWLLEKTVLHNPYAHWINYYAGSDDNVEMTEMLNSLTDREDPIERNKMLEAFRTACALELQFWDDAYAMRCWP